MVTESKNNYEKAGDQHKWKATGGALCPVAALTAWVGVRLLAGGQGQIFTPLRSHRPASVPTCIPTSSKNVYQSYRKALRKLATARGGVMLTPGSGRTTYATRSLRAGAKLEQVQASMRHEKVTTTLQYGASDQAKSAVRTLAARLEKGQTDEAA